jgi:sensor histidine kinase YesM
MDQLKVEYDLACTTFTIPTLTLQPLVENAITYGVRKNESGCGTVKLQTMELADCYKVIVTDNGPGFTPGELPEGERSHIGIRNVRTRLQQVCGGSLQIVSALGKGTTATITLPKTDAAADRLPGRKETQYADFCH